MAGVRSEIILPINEDEFVYLKGGGYDAQLYSVVRPTTRKKQLDLYYRVSKLFFTNFTNSRLWDLSFSDFQKIPSMVLDSGVIAHRYDSECGLCYILLVPLDTTDEQVEQYYRKALQSFEQSRCLN